MSPRKLYSLFDFTVTKRVPNSPQYGLAYGIPTIVTFATRA